MTTVSYCYILESFYKDYPNLVQILDIGDSSKHNIRTHICLQINYNGNRRFLGKTTFEVKIMNKNDLPLGFCFALAQNPDAMQIFQSSRRKSRRNL